MSSLVDLSRLNANQAALRVELALVRTSLERHVARQQSRAEDEQTATSESNIVAADEPLALKALCEAFELSSFERAILLLCAGIELDSRFAPLCAAAQVDARRNYPTFGLAFAALAEPHWSAMVPTAPLRYWRLLQLDSGASTSSSRLRIDERILHHLLGIAHVDERLEALLEPLEPATELLPSQQHIAQRIALLWAEQPGPEVTPIVQLCSGDRVARRAIAARAAALLGWPMFALGVDDVPAAISERDALVRLWEREVVLSGGVLMLDCDRTDAPDAPRLAALLLDRLRSPVTVLCHEAIRTERSSVRIDVAPPTSEEQRALWDVVLGNSAQRLNGAVDHVVAQFKLNAESIRAASTAIRAQMQHTADDALGTALWQACRAQARPRIEELAQRIETEAVWDDLVLPEPQLRILRQIAAAVRQRARVYEEWGFARRGARGLGVSAIFVGASGTGKTLAAEVLAGQLELDLYRIDISQVVSKYIGETEKNLRRVFDAAEAGGAILLFDEADALFGKRSEVKDSHDRYANIEVSYLLQRMEAYRGLAILTTNLKNAIDPAFMRRLRYLVHFPFPDGAHRAEIWRRVFPVRTPTDGLDPQRLAKLNIPGGNVRNIALNAAFLAAESGQPVRMRHLLEAARGEYAKLEKTLTDAEIGGWV